MQIRGIFKTVIRRNCSLCRQQRNRNRKKLFIAAVYRHLRCIFMNTLIVDRTPTKKIDICFCFEGDFPALYVTRLTATTRYLVRKRGLANRQTAYPRSKAKE